jgi:hypothetical protein
LRRALLIGIDDYPTLGSLRGCVADAVALNDLLMKNDDGTPNWRTELIVNRTGVQTLTRDRLRAELRSLFANSRDADLLFYFAGHGAQTPWGAELVAQDAVPNSLGVSMNDLVTLANDAPARSVTILLDCCFSGDVGNAPGLQAAGVAESFRLNRATIRENVTIMAASRGTEVAAEQGGHGAFTRVMLEGLAGGATDHRGIVTGCSLYNFVSPAFDAWEQRPVLKTYLTEPVVLRVGPAWIDPDMLRRLPEHFPREDHRLQLTPDHEGVGHRPARVRLPGPAAQRQPRHHRRSSRPLLGRHGKRPRVSDRSGPLFLAAGEAGHPLIRIACTGHRNLSGSTQQLISAELIEILAAAERPLVGLTSLADGADQLFADAVLALGGQLHAVIPSAGYEDAFPSSEAQSDFRALLDRAHTITVLPHAAPSEDAYLDAGQFIVDACDRLLAVWDSQPAAGKGGTGDVAEYARHKRVPVTVIWPPGARRA